MRPSGAPFIGGRPVGDRCFRAPVGGGVSFVGADRGSGYLGELDYVVNAMGNPARGAGTSDLNDDALDKGRAWNDKPEVTQVGFVGDDPVIEARAGTQRVVGIVGPQTSRIQRTRIPGVAGATLRDCARVTRTTTTH